MIRVSVTSLVVTLASITAGSIVLLWLWWEWRRYQSARKMHLRVRQCALCFYEFLPESTTDLTACPRCGAITGKR
jgi:uncharacterized paraquat-inducible protein A